jgi:hypothetical protein
MYRKIECCAVPLAILGHIGFLTNTTKHTTAPHDYIRSQLRHDWKLLDFAQILPIHISEIFESLESIQQQKNGFKNRDSTVISENLK